MSPLVGIHSQSLDRLLPQSSFVKDTDKPCSDNLFITSRDAFPPSNTDLPGLSKSLALGKVKKSSFDQEKWQSKFGELYDQWQTGIKLTTFGLRFDLTIFFREAGQDDGDLWYWEIRPGVTFGHFLKVVCNGNLIHRALLEKGCLNLSKVPEKERIELAQILLSEKDDCYLLLTGFHLYQIKDPEACFQIAKKVLLNTKNVSGNFIDAVNQFGVRGKYLDQLYELLMPATILTAYYIQKTIPRGHFDQATLVKLAHFCSAYSGFDPLLFCIECPEERTKLLQAALKNKTLNECFFENVQPTFFKDPQEFIPFLKSCTDNYGFVYAVKKNFKRFLMPKEEDRVFFAKAFAKTSSFDITLYDIQSKEESSAILKIAASHRSIEPQFLEKLELDLFIDMADLINFLGIISDCPKYTQTIGLTMQRLNVPHGERIRIAEACVSIRQYVFSGDPEKVFNIDDFGIEDYSERIRLLGLAAEKGRLAKSYFESMDERTFKNKDDLRTFLLAALNNYPNEVSTLIKNQRFLQGDEREKVIVTLFKQAQFFELIFGIGFRKTDAQISSDPLAEYSLSRGAAKDIFNHYIDDCINCFFPWIFFSRKMSPEFFDSFEKLQDEAEQHFKELFVHARKQHAFLRNELLPCVRILNVFYHGLCKKYDKKNAEKELFALKQLCEQIYKLRTPSLRGDIVRSLDKFLEFNPSKSILHTWYQLCQGSIAKGQPRVHVLIPCLLAYQISDDEKVVKSLAGQLVKMREFFKDANQPHYKLLLNYLVRIKKELENVKNIHLINQIFSCNDSDQRLSVRLRILSTLISLKHIDFLSVPKPVTNEDAAKEMQGIACKILRLDPKDYGGAIEFSQMYTKRLQDPKVLRDEDAPFVLAARVAELSTSQRGQFEEILSATMKSHLKDEMQELYLKSPQIQEIRKTRGRRHLVRNWLNPPPFCSIENFLPKDRLENLPFHEWAKMFFELRLLGADPHLDKLQDRLPFFYRSLNHQEDPVKLRKELQEITLKDSTIVNKLEIELLGLLVEEPSEKQLQEIKALVTSLKEEDRAWYQFVFDIDDLIRTTNNAKKEINWDKLTIGVTKKFGDMILIGRETGGCQNIDGSAENNKCIFAYIIDGKNCAVSIKGEDGRMLARAILRLMIDKTTNRPVIFMERTYDQQNNDTFKAALEKYAIAHARSLEMPLLTKDAKYKQIWQGTIKSVGSNAKAEYVDAIGGQTNGEFEIDYCRVMYDPKTDAGDEELTKLFTQ